MQRADLRPGRNVGAFRTKLYTLHHRERVLEMAADGSKTPEAGAPEFTFSCPVCAGPLRLDPSVRQAILDELVGWDSRFDRAESVADSILDRLMTVSRQSA